MKLHHLALIAALAALPAMPLAAKPTPIRSAAVWNDIERLERDVNLADQRDTISEREAAGLRAQIADLKQQYHKKNVGGLTPGEANALQSRIGELRQRLNRERRGPDHHRG
jgi:hypothetical protein